MASVTLVRTVSFSIYKRSKVEYSEWIKRRFGFDILAHTSTKGNYPNFYSCACFAAAGATAGSFITVLACPFELTKLSAQVSVLLAGQSKSPKDKRQAIAASYQNKGTLKTMATIVKHRGILGLYTGFNLHLRKYWTQRPFRSHRFLRLCGFKSFDLLSSSIIRLTRPSARYTWHGDIFCSVRK